MIAGIVCEYNPFHNGHLYQIEKTKQQGADGIVCVMSGNFVQRGECAIADKWCRAEIAVKSGADVVIDLPVPWAISSGESFARGSIFLLKQFGMDMLSFGSEYDDKQLLLCAAESVDDLRVQKKVKEYIGKGNSYPMSLSRAVEELYGSQTAKIISSPNSTLAVEYLRQLSIYGKTDFLPVKRKGCEHDGVDEKDGYLSASGIRKGFVDCEDMSRYLNKQSVEKLKSELSEGFFPCVTENNERDILSCLRSLEKGELDRYISDEQGLSSRIFESARRATSLTELYAFAKSKNYTHSRIRREVLNAYLKIEKDISKSTPPYIRVLAVNEKGLMMLSDAKKNSAIPIVTKHSEMQNLDDYSKRIYKIQCLSTDKFTLFSPKVRACGLEQKNSMLIIR